MPKDDLKWFGEGFDGFPKRLPEDSVEYTLFIVNLKLSQKEVLSRLEAVKKEAASLTKGLLQEYIWQRDAFELKLEQTPGMALSRGDYHLTNTCLDLIYLHGLTNYGDSVEDEWLIVYLLRELSKQFMDLWIKVIDTDGEFLLIEAANSLPKWLNPDIADNRVWINDSQLKIIPPTANPTSTTITGPPRALTQTEALSIIKDKPDLIEQFPQMEKEAFYRLTNYPAQTNASLHRSLVTVPRNLAFILHELPAVIAPAVEAFYLRDPIGLKPLHSTDTSGLTFPPTDLVTVSVKFTKVLFAQLKSQRFDPPPAWTLILHSAEKAAKTPAGQKEVERLEMGMKVTSGFEMLISDGIKRDNRFVREMNILLEDIEQGEPLPSDSEISSWKDAKREDSEAWLDINFEDFEKELQGKKGAARPEVRTPAEAQACTAKREEVDGKPTFGPERPPILPPAEEIGSGFGDAKTQQDLKKMVERFESFLADDEAGPDGAELDDDDYDNDTDEDEDEDEDSSEEEDEDAQPMLDPKAFAKMMREMMGVSTADLDDVPDFTGGTAPPMSAAGPLRGERAKGKGKGRKMLFGEVPNEESEGSDEGEEDEAEEFRKVVAAMDAELREAGALELDPKVKAEKPAAVSEDAARTGDKGKGKEIQKEDLTKKQEWESESEEEMDIDFNLAKNLLESFKSQAGMAGPGGNLMGMMGMKLPRDEGEEEEARKQAGKEGPYYRGGPLQ